MLKVFFLLFILNLNYAFGQPDSTISLNISVAMQITGYSNAGSLMPSLNIIKKKSELAIGPVMNIFTSYYTIDESKFRLTGFQTNYRKYIYLDKKCIPFLEVNIIAQRFRDINLSYTNIQNLYELYAGYGLKFQGNKTGIRISTAPGINRSARLYENSTGKINTEHYYNFAWLASVSFIYNLK